MRRRGFLKGIGAAFLLPALAPPVTWPLVEPPSFVEMLRAAYEPAVREHLNTPVRIFALSKINFTSDTRNPQETKSTRQLDTKAQ